MKRYDPMRADDRPIEDKALGLIFAMSNEAAARLHEKLKRMAESNCDRAEMFCGRK